MLRVSSNGHRKEIRGRVCDDDDSIINSDDKKNYQNQSRDRRKNNYRQRQRRRPCVLLRVVFLVAIFSFVERRQQHPQNNAITTTTTTSTSTSTMVLSLSIAAITTQTRSRTTIPLLRSAIPTITSRCHRNGGSNDSKSCFRLYSSDLDDFLGEGGDMDQLVEELSVQQQNVVSTASYENVKSASENGWRDGLVLSLEEKRNDEKGL